MKSPVTDRRTFEALRPEDVRVFLENSGFVAVAEDSRRADIWVNEKLAPDIELLVPRTAAVRDYSLRLAELFSLLSRLWNRDALEIVREVSMTGADLIRLRRPSFNEADASIRLRDGAALVTTALEMVGAAACSAVVPTAVLPSRRPNQALDYMRRVELGQSERGSYVVSIISRVAPLLTPGTPSLFEFIDQPFPRRVTTTLASALAATRAAADEVARDGNFSVFEDLVGRGLSANLCDTLGRMVEQEEASAPVNINLIWARSLPVAPDTPSEFTFIPSEVPLLKDAAAYLRSREPEPRVLLTGVVTDLHREPRDQEGEVTITTILEGKPRKLRVPLPGADYQAALDAHGERLPVMFRADIVKSGRQWRAENVSEFRSIARE